MLQLNAFVKNDIALSPTRLGGVIMFLLHVAFWLSVLVVEVTILSIIARRIHWPRWIRGIKDEPRLVVPILLLGMSVLGWIASLYWPISRAEGAAMAMTDGCMAMLFALYIGWMLHDRRVGSSRTPDSAQGNSHEASL